MVLCGGDRIARRVGKLQLDVVHAGNGNGPPLDRGEPLSKSGCTQNRRRFGSLVDCFRAVGTPGSGWKRVRPAPAAESGARLPERAYFSIARSLIEIDTAFLCVCISHAELNVLI